LNALQTRRTFLAGLCLTIAAPAIVRASSLMPVRAYIDREKLFKELILQTWKGSTDPDLILVGPARLSGFPNRSFWTSGKIIGPTDIYDSRLWHHPITGEIL
jgi:hypothetical protein